MVLKLCIVCHSVVKKIMICANFQNDMTTEIDVLDKRLFVRFEYNWVSVRYPLMQSYSPHDDVIK